MAVRMSAHERPSPPRLFWVAVAVPVLALWAARAPFPDLGYDVLNYHLMHGERALAGTLFPAGDFYPYFFPFLNPSGDMVLAVLRHALGYRAGTIGNALALVFTGEVLWRLLAPAVKDERVRAAAVLCIVATEGALWEVSGYMVDLLALPVLLEAARIAVSEGREGKPLSRRTAVLGLLLGTAVALKLTNLAFAVPIGLVALVRWLGPRAARVRFATLFGAAATGAATFLLPVAPHAFLLLSKTGNPVFPYFNGVFASPYLPATNIKDGRWGPESSAQALAWPLLSAFRPDRLSEIGTTSGRLALGWAGAAAALLFLRRDERLRALSAIVLGGGTLWSLGTGYHRYGLFCEIAGGLVLAISAARLAGLAEAVEGRALPPSTGRRRFVFAAALLAFVGAVQSGRSFWLAARSDWSGRPTVFHDVRASAREAKLLLRDRDLASFLPPEGREILARGPVWVDAVPKVNGIMTLLERDAPMIGLQLEGYLASAENRTRLDEALRVCRGRPAYSLAFDGDAGSAESALFRLGFPVLSRTPVSFPFFSHERLVRVVLFEVGLPPPLSTARADPVAPWTLDASLRGSIDDPVEAREAEGDLLVRGWARVPGEDLAVTVLVDGVEATPRSFRRVARPDVASVLPEMGDCSRAGYEAVLPHCPDAPVERVVSVVFRARDGRTRHYPGVRVRWTAGLVPGAIARH